MRTLTLQQHLEHTLDKSYLRLTTLHPTTTTPLNHHLTFRALALRHAFALLPDRTLPLPKGPQGTEESSDTRRLSREAYRLAISFLRRYGEEIWPEADEEVIEQICEEMERYFNALSKAEARAPAEEAMLGSFGFAGGRGRAMSLPPPARARWPEDEEEEEAEEAAEEWEAFKTALATMTMKEGVKMEIPSAAADIAWANELEAGFREDHQVCEVPIDDEVCGKSFRGESELLAHQMDEHNLDWLYRGEQKLW